MEPTETSAIEVQNLTKTFTTGPRPVTPVQDVSFDIPAGACVALMGHNGAGKTTLLKVLATIITPTRGTARIGGASLDQPVHVRRHIGLMTSEERSFFWRLTGRQNLSFFAALQGQNPARKKQRIAELVEQLELGEFIDRRFDRYSSGMKQILGLARVLLHDPRVLFLDEPTRSLDRENTLHFQQHLRALTRRGHTVLVATHDAHLARGACDRILYMKQGGIERTVFPVSGQGEGEPYRIRTSAMSDAERAALKARNEVAEVLIDPATQTAEIHTTGTPDVLHDLLQHLLLLKLHIIDCRPAGGEAGS